VPQFAQKSNDDPTLSQTNEKNSKIVIQKGEKVYILKTPKGCYLRTQDKKYIALRNKSLEESFMLGNSNNNSPQIIPQEASSYASANGQNFEQTPNYNSYYNGNSNNNNNNITSQAQVAQLDLPSNMLTSHANNALPMISSNTVSTSNNTYNDSNLDFNLNLNSNTNNNYCPLNQNTFQNDAPASSVLSSSPSSFSYQSGGGGGGSGSEFPLLSAENFQNQMHMMNESTALIAPQSP
jgi:hypothetical protein